MGAPIVIWDACIFVVMGGLSLAAIDFSSGIPPFQ